MSKKVLLTGITGQDGSILAEKYLQRGYSVNGIVRRATRDSLGALELVPNRQAIALYEGDVTDFGGLVKIYEEVKPDIFINAAAQSHVGLSFDQPGYTIQATGVAVGNCLEVIRLSRIKARFLQLSSSEMFGGLDTSVPGVSILDENSYMEPRSPYAAAKLFGYNLTKIYRVSYGLHASNSICFNHEEPGRRGPNFVTRKITRGIANLIKSGYTEKIKLGNIDAYRDWGWASDYCEGMMMILDHDTPNDYVLATGETHSVREFLNHAFGVIGIKDWSPYVEFDPALIRPNEVNVLKGDYSFIKNTLGWEPQRTFYSLVKQMLLWDLYDMGIDPLVGLEVPGLKILAKATESK